jgi:5'-3' exonuclease
MHDSPRQVLHLVDGTFELFRHYYGAPKVEVDGREVGATRGLLRSLHTLASSPGTTHVAVAFDRVIESFRNQLFDGYKTGSGIEPTLLAQFPLAEAASRSLGLATWPMVEFEADDALASGAWRFRDQVDQVVVCTPDKDLAQCVIGTKVVLRDRIRKTTLDEEGVLAKFGVPPASIPDWLALVGDSADGIPGIPRWGAKSAATVLRHFGSIDRIPDDPDTWGIKVRGAKTLATNLQERRTEAALYRRLATLRTDVPIQASLDELRWRGARSDLMGPMLDRLDYSRFADRVEIWQEG